MIIHIHLHLNRNYHRHLHRNRSYHHHHHLNHHHNMFHSNHIHDLLCHRHKHSIPFDEIPFQHNSILNLNFHYILKIKNKLNKGHIKYILLFYIIIINNKFIMGFYFCLYNVHYLFIHSLYIYIYLFY